MPVVTVLLTGLLLGPALGPGYVLSYDMVWVPELALRSDFLGVGSALPRAVPSDAVIAVLDQVVPAMLLQKVALAGPLIAAGIGAARLLRSLAPGIGTAGRLGAAVIYLWNPFVVERLVIGHWPVLIGYGLAPWLWLAARSARDGRIPLRLLWLLPLASLSATTGLASALVVLVVGWRGGLRTRLLLLASAMVANLPWLAAGLLHASDATSDAAGAATFALRSEGLLPAPLAALGLGGIWNSEVAPASRGTWVAVAALVVSVAVAALGWARWRAETPRADRLGLLVCWAMGFGVAVLSWAASGVLGEIAASVPGGGLLRDGSRLLGLCALLLAVLVGLGVQRVSDLVAERTGDRAQAGFVAGVVALLPIAGMADAAWGSAGHLQPVEYPSAFGNIRQVMGPDPKGDVLLLPFTSYRAPEFNGGRKVLDPWGRYLRPNYVANDELLVRGRLLRGEDPRGAEVRQALAADDPDDRAEALGRLGIGWVVQDLETAAPNVDLGGVDEFPGETANLFSIPSVEPRQPHGLWLMIPAWVLFALSFGTGIVAGIGAAVTRLTRKLTRQ